VEFKKKKSKKYIFFVVIKIMSKKKNPFRLRLACIEHCIELLLEDQQSVTAHLYLTVQHDFTTLSWRWFCCPFKSLINVLFLSWNFGKWL